MLEYLLVLGLSFPPSTSLDNGIPDEDACPSDAILIFDPSMRKSIVILFTIVHTSLQRLSVKDTMRARGTEKISYVTVGLQ